MGVDTDRGNWCNTFCETRTDETPGRDFFGRCFSGSIARNSALDKTRSTCCCTAGVFPKKEANEEVAPVVVVVVVV